MVDICGGFANNRNLKFSTNANSNKSNTKGIIFSPKPKERMNVLKLGLNSDNLPWVYEGKHLGNTLESNNSMSIKK